MKRAKLGARLAGPKLRGFWWQSNRLGKRPKGTEVGGLELVPLLERIGRQVLVGLGTADWKGQWVLEVEGDLALDGWFFGVFGGVCSDIQSFAQRITGSKP